VAEKHHDDKHSKTKPPSWKTSETVGGKIAELRQTSRVRARLRGRITPAWFMNLEGLSSTYYVFKYPTGHESALMAYMGGESDPEASW